jgi:plasmid stabilization system protein ParE
MRPQWHPLAEKEAAEAREWYAAHSASAAERFVNTLEVTIEFLRRELFLFAIREHGLRVALINGFPYSVIYREMVALYRFLRLHMQNVSLAIGGEG